MLLAGLLPLIIEKLVLIVIVVMASLVIAMYATYGERKIAAGASPPSATPTPATPT